MRAFKLAFLFLLLSLSLSWAAPQGGISPCLTNPAAISANGTSSTPFQFSACGETVIVFNNSNNDAFFVVTSSSASAVATTSSKPLPAKTFVVLNVGTSQLWFAAITAGSTATIQFIQGTASQ